MGWNLNGQVPLPPCTFTSTRSWSLARGTLLGLSQSLLSGRDLFLVLVDEVCTCLGNGLFSVFFHFGYRKLHPFGRINLIITSELTFHTQTAGLYLGRHLIQREIFPVCFSQPISLLEAAVVPWTAFDTKGDLSCMLLSTY